MRQTKFYDIPVYYTTREKIRKLKKKRKARSYDELIEGMLHEIREFEF